LDHDNTSFPNLYEFKPEIDFKHYIAPESLHIGAAVKEGQLMLPGASDVGGIPNRE
jgi:hypothetical protein